MKKTPKKLELRAHVVRHFDLRQVQGGRANTEYPTCGGSIVCVEAEGKPD